MTPVDGSKFKMGSPESERRRRADEGPIHTVILSDYWISTLEISWDLYETFLLRNQDSILVNNQIPYTYHLFQNYPNPFNPVTKIRYDIPKDALVSITIYDIMGRSIRSLVKSRQTAGYRSIQWNATNNLGQPVSAGIYIYMIQAGEFMEARKLVLLK